MSELTELAGKAFLIGIFAFAGEAVNEFLIAPWMDLLKDKLNDVIRQQAMRLWSAGVGVLIAYEFEADVFALLGAQARQPLFGIVLTGILLGRGSNWIHEMLKKFGLQVQEAGFQLQMAEGQVQQMKRAMKF